MGYGAPSGFRVASVIQFPGGGPPGADGGGSAIGGLRPYWYSFGFCLPGCAAIEVTTLVCVALCHPGLVHTLVWVLACGGGLLYRLPAHHVGMTR